MSTIKVECPTCNYIWLDARRVILTVGPGGSSYRFDCVCGQTFVKHCSERIGALLALYVATETVELEPHDGPPLTNDDLLDMAVALRSDNWLDELTS